MKQNVQPLAGMTLVAKMIFSENNDVVKIIEFG